MVVLAIQRRRLLRGQRLAMDPRFGEKASMAVIWLYRSW